MKLLCIALFLLGSTFPAFSQQPQKELSGEEKQQVIEIAAEKLSKNYVFPDTARKYADHLRKRLKSGAYNEIKSPVEFAQALKADLHSIYHDKHLSVNYNPGLEQAMANTGQGGHGAPNPNMEKKSNAAFRNVHIKPGNIGYVRFDGFSALTENTKRVIDQAFGFVLHADALIIDLRYNGGGDPRTVQYISNYLFNAPTHINSLYQRDRDTTIHFVTSVITPNMSETPVYVLTSNNTFSAAEEFTYNLKSLKRAVIIGEATKGGAHPVRSFPTAHGIILNIPFARAINPITKTNWEAVGIAPDINAPFFSALDVAYAKALAQLAENNKNAPIGNYFKWHAGKMNAVMNKSQVSAADLEKIAGNYGPVTIEYKEGQLQYKRAGFSTFILNSISKKMLLLDGVENQYIEVVSDAAGSVTGIKINFDNGKSETLQRGDQKTKTF